MKDDNGKIFQDSLTAFYKPIDTTHQFHSIKSTVKSYEYSETNFISITRKDGDTIIGVTQTNAGTHCRLSFKIVNNICMPIIKLNSIVSNPKNRSYPCKNGKIVIDKKSWNQGIMKAEFDFTFENHENGKEKLFWKGKIYSKIKQVSNH